MAPFLDEQLTWYHFPFSKVPAWSPYQYTLLVFCDLHGSSLSPLRVVPLLKLHVGVLQGTVWALFSPTFSFYMVSSTPMTKLNATYVLKTEISSLSLAAYLKPPHQNT